MRVLLVEDDQRVAAAVRRGLETEHIVADLAATGEEALVRCDEGEYAVVVLDLMLPGIDGIETCRRLRGAQVWTPILMLTARDAVVDRVTGLNSGADDYLVKPFSFEELLARLHALARRGSQPRPATLQVGDLELDPRTHTVTRAGRPIELSAREIAVLEVFMRRPGHVVSRLALLEDVWGEQFDHRSNVVDVAVRRLREKIDRPFATNSLETVRGAGYRLCASTASPSAQS